MQQILLEYSFVLRALAGALLASITAGIAGTYIVSRRMVFLSGGVTHASFGGIGLGHFAGFSPVAGAAVFGVISALGVEYLSGYHKIREDSAIGILWALGMATGIIFIYLTPGYSPNLMSYLFGSILTVTMADLVALAILSVVLIIYFTLFYRTILYLSFDEVYARTYTRYADHFKYISISLVALTIVLNIRMAGVILVLSLLTIPPNIVMLFTRVYKRVLIWSVITGFAGTISGFTISWFAGVPAGATVIFTLVVMWIICRVISGIFAVKRNNVKQKTN
jgi:zinc transport system permease protein